MHLEMDTVARAYAMVKQCGLDSMSLFFCDRRRAAPRLTYLYHHGVSAEAQHIYLHNRVFEEDPFTRVLGAADRQGRMIRWCERDVADAAETAVNYRTFLTHHSVDVVGAFVQQIMPQLFLVLGAHCRPGSHRTADVAERLLDHESGAVAAMVVAQLLDGAFGGSAGTQLIDVALDAGMASAVATPLSAREREIARLVCAGMQNKHIAYDLGLSEYTVENHLRRIYRKLGVHNRTGMVAAVAGRPTLQ